MLCFALAANWDVELLRLEMIRRDGTDALRALDARFPDHLPATRPHPAAPSIEDIIQSAGPSAERLAEDLRAIAKVLPLGGASNAWALSGKKTASGRPIVASDPHLEPVAPPHWHISHVVTPQWRVRGACFTGVPGFAIGHNERVAWGVTAAHADNTDLFLEEVGADGKSVRDGDRFVPCEERLEAIPVRGEPPFMESILTTPRGPIVGPALDGAGVGISISATWLSDRPYTGLLSAHKAKTAKDLLGLFREASASSICLVAADVDDHIAWQLSVELPKRKRGNGLVPLPGWEPNTGWEDSIVPYEAMPRAFDPETGFFALANNAPVPLDHEPFLGADFLDGYRAKVLCDALRARNDWDRASTQSLQKDTRSIPWEEMKAAVMAVRCEGDALRAQELLRTWNGRMGEHEAGASVFAVFVSALTKRAVEAKAPRTARRALGEGFNPMLPHNTMVTRRLGHFVRLVNDQPAGFFDEGWHRAIAAALATAYSTLRERAGNEPSQWAWGRVRPLRLQHLFSRVNPLLDKIFGVGPLPSAGDSSTLVQGIVDLLDPFGNALGVPNLRVFFDVGDFSRSRFALLGGQSGNPLSNHYADHIDGFYGEGHELAWTDAEIAERTRHRLTLIAV